MTHVTDVFLSHNWGNDEFHRDNHERVSKINEKLKKLGYQTWFDEEQMRGAIVDRMAEGIQGTKAMIVFITKTYCDKVNGKDESDNCKLEFNFAAKRVKMLAVVMEQNMRDTQKWKGSIGIYLGQKLFIDMCGNLDDQNYVNQRMNRLQDELDFMEIKPSNTVDRNNVQLHTGIFVFALLLSFLLELKFII